MIGMLWPSSMFLTTSHFAKWLVVKNMELGQSIPIIDQVFYITSHRNTGAAWGILAGQMWFFYLITTAVIIGIVYYIQRYTYNAVCNKQYQ